MAGPETLISGADAMLIRSKEAGRDRVSSQSESGGPAESGTIEPFSPGPCPPSCAIPVLQANEIL
jgi:hypothetical protein